jgi:hypothetical protein
LRELRDHGCDRGENTPGTGERQAESDRSACGQVLADHAESQEYCEHQIGSHRHDQGRR